MGGGGFMLDAVKTMKANRTLLKKRNSKKSSFGPQQTLTRKIKTFKRSTPEDVEKVRKAMQAYNAQLRRGAYLALVIMIVLFVLLWSAWLYF